MSLITVAAAFVASSCHGESAPGAGGDGASTVSSSSGGITLDGGFRFDAGSCEPDAAPFDAGDPGCSGVAPAAYQADVLPILQPCTGELCHDPPVYDTIVGRPARQCCDGRVLVVPGDASASYLVQKIRGEHLCAGVEMPLGLPMLSLSDIDLITGWICAGAPND